LPDGRVDQLRVSFDMPALAKAVKGQLSLLLNGEKATLDLDLDSPKKVLSGEAFALRAGLSSDQVSAKVDGTVQQAPMPGLSGGVSVDIGSIAGLAAWLGQTLPKGQPDPGPLAFAAQLMAEGDKLAVESMTLDGKAVKASGKGSFDGSGEIIRFSGLLDISNLDLNAYLPPDSGQEPKKAQADGAAAGGGKKKKAGAAGWSEKPFRLGVLRQAEGNFKVKTGQVLYRTVVVKESSTTVALDAGILTASINKLNLDQGRASGNVVVDASKKAAGLSYELSLKGIESKPFLESFAEIDWLSGRLVFDTKGAAKGRNEKEVVESLNGDGVFKFKDGAIEGFDLAGTLRNAQALGISSAEGSGRPKTEFSELGGSYTITDGLLNNPDFKMLAPLVRVTGAGVADLPPRSLDYQVEAKLVSSLEGQGSDEALAGLPIPVHAHGPWDNLAFDIDWKTVLGTAVLDPALLENLPDGLSEAAKGLGVVIPGAATGSGDDSAATSSGGSSLESAVGGALNSLFGGSDDEAISEEQPKKKKKKKKKKAQQD
jgi:AsmA protein